jgi:hypothetical protein
VLLLGSGFLEHGKLRPVVRGMIATGLGLLLCAPLYWFLILRLDRPYLLIIPPVLLAIGIGSALTEPETQETVGLS